MGRSLTLTIKVDKEKLTKKTGYAVRYLKIINFIKIF